VWHFVVQVMRLAHPGAFVLLALAVNLVMAEALAISLWGGKLKGWAARCVGQTLG
jgi:hypothetical protein